VVLGFVLAPLADLRLRYKTAATISHKVLEEVTKWLADGEKIVDLCIKGDELLDEELSKGMLASDHAVAADGFHCDHPEPGAEFGRLSTFDPKANGGTMQSTRANLSTRASLLLARSRQVPTSLLSHPSSPIQRRRQPRSRLES
jgi:hypothetical protein